jgi:hypothetical protein
MNKWLRRLVYLVIFLAWLVLVSLPFFAFNLAARQQLQLGSSEGSHLRIFVLQEPSAEGIGVEWARPASVRASCMQTDLRYFMWEGEPDNVAFCQCFDTATGAAQSATPNACAPPTLFNE